MSLHAWCAGTPWWYSRSLVVTFANPTGADVDVTLAALPADITTRTQYFLTSSAEGYTASVERVAAGTRLAASAPPASLSADAVYLNGELMTVDDSGVQPHQPMPGHVVADARSTLTLPPYSYGFVSYSGSTPKGC